MTKEQLEQCSVRERLDDLWQRLDGEENHRAKADSRMEAIKQDLGELYEDLVYMEEGWKDMSEADLIRIRRENAARKMDESLEKMENLVNLFRFKLDIITKEAAQ